MDHDEAVRLKATEKYLLDELDPDSRDQFEEHLFDCQDCALDLRAAAMFVEQSKAVLADPATTEVRIPAAVPAMVGWRQSRWYAWFRPAWVVPVFALLLLVIGYQNFVTYPQRMQAANQPEVGPWASVNVSTRGSSTTTIKVRPNQGFSLLLNLPPEGFASYQADLYNPAGKLEWSGTMSAPAPEEGRQIYVPGGNRQSGIYALLIHGITATGESHEISRQSVDVQIQH
jgi:Putative zinc-finger